ncbi:MAG: iron-sulfur cluster assembly scaffold protein [Patescibacteria group bacterium]|jgi:nitrogen fixation NifU-like protein|nr:iron-sulfur cluster assembly scaffold protein [Patescibacteria group bacterium]MDD5164538.1 iron-sulfur cluster assembly scaffold protein [Patescibacteria group bacterium]MDD5534720.1 iron-sulfur cluster assembly scaffold protein [Patescibacteria group bacterium]
MFEQNPQLIDHFLHPRNVGKMENPDGLGHVGNPVCGDVMDLYIRVKDNKIIEAKFQTYGCAAAVASTSVLTELIIGKTIEEALEISHKKILDVLGQVPANKNHCTFLAEQALKLAIEDFQKKQK